MAHDPILAARLRELRENSNYRQKELAAYLQCTQVSYSNYEVGKRSVPVDVIIRLAKFYDVSTDYLLGLTENKARYPGNQKSDGGTHYI